MEINLSRVVEYDCVDRRWCEYTGLYLERPEAARGMRPSG